MKVSDRTFVIFLIVCCFYLLFFLIGLIVSRRRETDVATLVRIGNYLVDPLSKSIHRKMRPYKHRCLVRKKWPALFVLIFLNNLLVVAFIQHVLYGVVFFMPLVLVSWYGFGHGVLFSKRSIRSEFAVVFVEFLGYLIASSIGVQIGLALLKAVLTSGPVSISVPWQPVLLSTFYILLAALLETIELSKGNYENRGKNLEIYLDEARRDEFHKKLNDRD